MRTSKSPKAVLLWASRVGCRRLTAYSHPYSPKKYQQPQLFACLALKEFLRLDYRKLSALLKDSDLARVIELQSVPHFTTLQKASRRFLHEQIQPRQCFYVSCQNKHLTD